MSPRTTTTRDDLSRKSRNAKRHSPRRAQPGVVSATFERQTLAVRQAAVIAAVVLPGALFWPPAFDNFDIVKFSALLVAVGVLLAVTAGRLLATGQLRLPQTPVLWAAGAFLAAYSAATLASDKPVVSFFGVHRRYTGLLLYLCCAALLLAVLRLFDERTVSRIAFGLAASGAVAIVYGVMQLAGADPLAWSGVYGDVVFSTLGNPNFAAAYLAICLPVLGWVALSRRSVYLRWAAGLLLPCALLAILGTRASQGVIAGGASMTVLAFAWLLDRPPRQRKVALTGLGLLTISGTLVAGAGLLGVGPAAGVSQQVGTTLRGYYWRAAVAMFADHPLLGVGPDRYGVNYRIYRPVEAVLANDLPQGNDAAHNVVLQHFATGGLLAGTAYLAVVGLTAWALITGLRRLQGEQRLLLGALGGAWTAYQVESFISIDVPALASVHWILAGAVVVLAAPPTPRTVTLPWVPRGRSTSRSRTRQSTRGAVIAVALGAVVLWAGTVPFRADNAAGRGNRLGTIDDIPAALEVLQRATSLAPWEYTYWFERADWQLQAGRPREALGLLEVAAQRDPGDLKNPLAAARIAAENQDPELAVEWYRDALRIEPQHPQLKVETARVMASLGIRGEARQLLHQALDIDPDNAEARRLLSRVAG